jgi:hypothetical protein
MVLLRQPRLHDPEESRTDPFYEFGSFGLTGCHGRNLLHDERISGSRLAFAQGGPGEFRLVMLTPPVDVLTLPGRREARWQPMATTLLRFACAPLLIDNDGKSEVVGLIEAIREVRRHTWVARFASRFRSRKVALAEDIASSMAHVWEQASRAGDRCADNYCEALPFLPPKPDQDRLRTYERLRGAAELLTYLDGGDECPRRPPCESRRRSGCS